MRPENVPDYSEKYITQTPLDYILEAWNGRANLVTLQGEPFKPATSRVFSYLAIYPNPNNSDERVSTYHSSRPEEFARKVLSLRLPTQLLNLPEGDDELLLGEEERLHQDGYPAVVLAFGLQDLVVVAYPFGMALENAIDQAKSAAFRVIQGKTA